MPLTISKEASNLRHRASEAHRAGQALEARQMYATYLALVPQDAGIWSNLGALLRAEARHDQALRAHERAFALDPNSTVIMNNYANILSDIGQYDRALPLRRKILKVTPDDQSQKAMIGKALRALGRYQESITHLERSINEHPDYAEMRIQLALTQLSDRRYAEGFRNYEVRWETGELTPRQMKTPQWDYTPLDGKTILVMPEQGFGDAVAFSRFLPLLRRYNPARVLVYAEKPMQRIFDGLDGADWVGTQLPPGTSYDVWTNVMDLCPLHFDQSDLIPPPTRLAVPADSIAKAQALTAPYAKKFKVGIVWSGSVTYRGNAFRSFSHTEFLPLTDLPDVQLFSLYKGPNLAEYQADGTNCFIIDTASTDRDFADCAASMQAMDLIITSDTATAHIAGSLGLEVWTLLHWDAFWLWQHQGSTTPWYPTMKLFRQATPRDWAGVFAKVRKKLEGQVALWKRGQI